MTSIKNEKLQGALLMILSCSAFSLMQIFVRLSAGAVSLPEQVFFRNLIGFIIAAIVIRLEKLSFKTEPKYSLALLIRSLFGFIGLFFLFYASAHARQADVSLLSRTSSIWVFLFQSLLGQKITKTQVLIIIICMLGSVIAINPRFDSAVIPLLCASATSMFSGAAYTAIGYCKGHVDPFVVIFYFCIFSTICAGVMMLGSFTVPTGMTLVYLLMIGFTAAIGQIGLTFGLQKCTAGTGSIYEYFTIITSAILGFLCFGEHIALTTVIGSVLIITGAVINYRSSIRHAS